MLYYVIFSKEYANVFIIVIFFQQKQHLLYIQQIYLFRYIYLFISVYCNNNNYCMNMCIP